MNISPVASAAVKIMSAAAQNRAYTNLYDLANDREEGIRRMIEQGRKDQLHNIDPNDQAYGRLAACLGMLISW